MCSSGFSFSTIRRAATAQPALPGERLVLRKRRDLQYHPARAIGIVAPTQKRKDRADRMFDCGHGQPGMPFAASKRPSGKRPRCDPPHQPAGRSVSPRNHRLTPVSRQHFHTEILLIRASGIRVAQNGALRCEVRNHIDPDRRRHMIRIFLRDDGARTYNG